MLALNDPAARYSGNGVVPLPLTRDADDSAAARRYTPHHNMGAEAYGYGKMGSGSVVDPI